MKTKKMIKRTLAAFISLLMIFSAIPMSVFAGSSTTIAGASNVEFGVISGSYSKYGHELHYAKLNGTSYIMWCGQYGKTSPQNTTYTKGTDYYAYINSQISATTAEYVYFGYTLQFGNTIGSLSSSSTFAGLTAAQCACACQQYVWQAIGGSYPSKSSWSSSYMNSDIYTTWYNATKALVNAYHNADVSFDDTTIELTEGSSTTLTDKNGYLQYYPSFSVTKKGLTFKHTKGSNTLTITASSSVSVNSFAFDSEDYGYYLAIPDSISWSNTTNYDSDENKYVYCKFNSYQNLFASEYASAQSFSINIEIETAEVGALKIVKTAEDSSALDDLSGFQFKVKGVGTDGDTYYSATLKTNSSGVIEIEDLDVYDDDGGLITYTVTEKNKPTRYATPTYSPSQSVTLKEDATVTVTVNNPLKRGDLYIQKAAEDDVLKGHEFKITWEYNGKTYTDTATTNSSGVAKFTDLLVYDTDNTKIEYTITETNVATRYNSPDDITVKLIYGDIQEVEFSNTLKTGKLKIVKTSYDDIVEGMKFLIEGVGTDGVTYYSKTKTTDENGEIEVTGLRVYDSSNAKISYTVTETSSNKRYDLPESKTVTLTADSTKTVSVYNPPTTGDLKIVKTSGDGVVKGFTFTVTGVDSNGDTVYSNTATTGSDGTYTITDLYVYDSNNKKITYTVTETNVPVRYITPDSVSHTLTANDTTEFSVYNELKKADIKIVKSEESGTVYDSTFENGAGWSFTVSWTWNGTDYNKTITTGSDGTATLTDLYVYDYDNSKITYTISEGSKSDGTTVRYVTPSDQSGTLSWESAEYNLTSTFSFTNYLKRWSAAVTKSDAETGSRAQGDASLAGAVYGVYKGGALVDTYITDASGQFTTKNYICGDDWTIKEITPSEGYLLDETEYSVGAQAKLYTVRYNSTANSVVETVIKGQIAIIKHSDDGSTQIETPEAGAEFQIYLKSAGSYDKAYETERDTLVCDENGYAISKELPYGVYTVHQTKGWDGTEYIADFDVYISTDGMIYRYLINNAPFSAYLQIVKADAETGETIPYAGAGFQIYDSDGNLVTMKYTYPSVTVIDTFYTNSEGYLITPEKLDYGEYTLVEVQAPYGYVLDSSPVSFKIEREASYTDSDFEITIVEVTAQDMPQKGVIEIAKTGEIFSSVTEADGSYTPVYDEQALAGAVFEIYAAEDVVTPDGTLRYMKDELVDTITTDKTGIAKSKELYLGKYTVIELTAPDTFYNDGTEYSIELTYQGQEIDVFTVEQSVYNERQTVTVSLTKVMESDSTYGITGNFASVLFGLYAAEEITAADGSVIPQDGLITSARCDENGSITFDCDLPIGFNFYVQEIETDERYVLNDTKYDFDTTYQGQDIQVIEINVNENEAIENRLIRGSVQITKTDRETGAAVAGVLFGLFDSSVTEYTEKNAILTVTTDENGYAEITDVPYGQYTIKELSPAAGYLESLDYHHFSIQLDGQNVAFSVVNDKIPELKTTAVAESNGTHTVTAQGTITIVDTVAYQHLVPGKTYTLKGVLMDKSTGKELVVNSETVKSTITFTPETSDGTVDVRFTFDAAGITVTTETVVFETLYLDGRELATHSDMNDTDQTITILVPTLKTTAAVNGNKDVTAQGEVTITDTVTFTNLEPGTEYTLKGVLMNKATGKAFKVNGKKITSTVTFILEARNGTVDVTFTFDTSGITADTQLVVFETLYYNDTVLTEHSDMNDTDQTVTILVPTMKTTATVNGKKEATAQGEVTITDTVTYTNLEVGTEYTLKGVLMNKSTGKAFKVNGEKVTSTVTFTPETRDGSVDVTFTFDTSGITADTQLVVFETLYFGKTELLDHSDLTDTDQTVTILVPTIKTTATVNGAKEATAQGDITITDTVTYTNLEVGTEYTLVGVLMNKATGKAFKVNGEKVTSTVTFTPEKRDGSTDVTFAFSVLNLKKDLELVVFETLYCGDTEWLDHSDLTDNDQTVTILVPTLQTTATINGEKEAPAEGEVTITDTVTYTNLEPGTEYSLVGVLMNKSTGKAFKVNGEKVTSTVTFTPEERDGSVDVTFTFDTSGITANTDIVVFETLFFGDTVIAEHTVTNDKNQTVKLTVENVVYVTTTGTTDTTGSPKTGNDFPSRLIITLAAFAIVDCLAALLVKKTRKMKGGEMI